MLVKPNRYELGQIEYHPPLVFHVKHCVETFRADGCYTYRDQYTEMKAMCGWDTHKGYVSRETSRNLRILSVCSMQFGKTHLVFGEFSKTPKNAQ